MRSRLSETHLSLAILCAVIAVQAWALLPELSPTVIRQADAASHFSMIEGMVDAVSHGGNQLDFWSPELCFGFPIVRTYQIFAHVQQARGESAATPDTLRISIDTKAKVKVGDFSRGGERRGAEAVKALDHDMAAEAVLVPFGVLELTRGGASIHQPWFLFGHSRQTTSHSFRRASRRSTPRPTSDAWAISASGASPT